MSILNSSSDSPLDGFPLGMKVWVQVALIQEDDSLTMEGEVPCIIMSSPPKREVHCAVGMDEQTGRTFEDELNQFSMYGHVVKTLEPGPCNWPVGLKVFTHLAWIRPYDD